MENRIYQHCYTNTTQNTADGTRSGWMSVAVSEDIPPEAAAACEKFQNADATNKINMQDERGNILNLYEIIGDGKYLYVMRTQYGLTDSNNRSNNMFSYAFIFHFNHSNIVDDPNIFLSLKRSNFKTTEEDAINWDGVLKKEKGLTLEEALHIIGINREQYATLISCVYAQMSEKNQLYPLHIYYDGTDQQLRALLYCVYFGLPHYMRKKLRAGTWADLNNTEKNIIFSEKAKEKDVYLIPQTEENNILTDRVKSRIKRYGYIDYAALSLEEKDFPDFFKNLNNIASALGDPAAANASFLKLAFQVLTNNDFTQHTDEQLKSNISDALSFQSSSSTLELIIARILDEIAQRGLILSPTNERDLEARLAKTQNETLKKEGLKYHISKLYAEPIEEAVRRLRELPADSFSLYSDGLNATPQGQKILESYYRSIIEEETLSWESLSRICDKPDQDRKMRDEVEKKAWELYIEQIVPGSDATHALDEYSRLMKKLLPNQLRYSECILAAKETYWKKITLSDCDFSNFEQYEKFQITNDSKCRVYCAYAKLAAAYEKDKERSFLQKLYYFFDNNKTQIVNDTEKKEAVSHLAKFLIRTYTVDKDFSRWMYMAALADTLDLLESIQSMYRVIEHFDAIELMKEYPRFVEKWQNSRKKSATIRSEMSRLLEKACNKNDSENTPVPLDLWLYIGMERHRNCFDIFDEDYFEPAILELDSSQVVSQSELMYKAEYQENAQKYISEKGAESKAVKSWLKESKSKKSAPKYLDTGKDRAFTSANREVAANTPKKKGLFWNK